MRGGGGGGGGGGWGGGGVGVLKGMIFVLNTVKRKK